ncbi:MAG: VOC family protein [Chloroflexota bacterium]|nr:VOC family protein [Chloroflexota bacterium]
MATRVQVVIDCDDPDRLAHFWAEALGYQLQPPPEGFASWEDFLAEIGVPEDERDNASAIVDPEGIGPRVYFQRVPEPKTVKNRMHLDLNQTTRDTLLEERRRLVGQAVERLKGLGAAELYRMDRNGEYHITMSDPEGNEFCVQ